MPHDLSVFMKAGAPKLIDASSWDFESTLSRIVQKQGAKVIYVYSPFCGACKESAPVFASAVRNLGPKFYRFNAMQSDSNEANEMASSIFHKITGARIEYYPMYLGISAEGRLVVFNGSVTESSMDTFLKALERT